MNISYHYTCHTPHAAHLPVQDHSTQMPIIASNTIIQTYTHTNTHVLSTIHNVIKSLLPDCYHIITYIIVTASCYCLYACPLCVGCLSSVIFFSLCHAFYILNWTLFKTLVKGLHTCVQCTTTTIDGNKIYDEIFLKL